jgi:carbonic anhydrase
MDASAGKLELEGEFIHKLVDRIMPTVERSHAAGETSIDDITSRHVADTIEELLERSNVISSAVKTGKLAVVGANYKLELGDIHMVVSHGDL